MVERARIILACLDGRQIQQVAKDLDFSIPTVSKWRKRFGQQGLTGLRDEPRSGKPPTYDAAFRDRVLGLLEQTPPCMPFGESCGRKEFISNACELGA